MLPHLDDAEIPLPSVLFQFAWKNREALLNDSLAEYQEPDWWREVENPEDLNSPIILKDDWGASVRVVKRPEGFIFDGETCGDHGYYVIYSKNDDEVAILIKEDPSEYFIPLLLALNEHAEDFGMKRCKIFIDQTKYRKLLYDDLFEHFAESPRHHSNLVCSDAQENLYEMIHYFDLNTIAVPGMGSLGGFLACRPNRRAYHRYELVIGT